MKPEELIKEGRRVGNTTRLVDYYIQALIYAFLQDKGDVEILDHVNVKQAHIDLIKRIKRRLAAEHPQYKLIHKKEKGHNNYFLIQIT